MTDHKDFMHGAALVAIAEHPRFSALNRASDKYGHFKVNDNRHVFIKYRDGEGPDYAFNFNHDDVRLMQSSASRTSCVYAILVCGTEVITALDAGLGKLIDMKSLRQQWVKVRADPRKRLRIRGPLGELGRPIPRNAFPGEILESGSAGM
jgi:hypothetical protein